MIDLSHPAAVSLHVFELTLSLHSSNIYIYHVLFFLFYLFVFFLCSTYGSWLFAPRFVLLQLFKEELTQVKEGMKQINELAHQLAISDVHLSMENARALEHLNSRWKLLQVVYCQPFTFYSIFLFFQNEHFQ